MLSSSFPRFEGDYFGPWILEYCRELANQGCKVFVVVPMSGDNDSGLLSTLHVTIKSFKYFYPKKLQKLVSPPGIIPNLKKSKLLVSQLPTLGLNYFIQVYKCVKQNKVDLIHSQWAIPSGLIGALVGKFLDIPHVITTQGAELFLRPNGVLSKLARVALRSSVYLFPVSEHMKDKAKGLGLSTTKIKVIPNAVNVDKFKPGNSSLRNKYNIPADNFIFLTVRRLVKEKRVDDIIHALAKSGLTNVSLIIVGGGPEKSYLETLVSDSSIHVDIFFTDFVPNNQLYNYYTGSDGYILSSQQEGLSLSLLESMASGLIPISTSSTGSSDVISNGMNGLLYDVGNVNALVLQMNNLVKMSVSDRKKMQQAAVETIRAKFSTKVITSDLIEIYSSIIS